MDLGDPYNKDLQGIVDDREEAGNSSRWVVSNTFTFPIYQFLSICAICAKLSFSF